MALAGHLLHKRIYAEQDTRTVPAIELNGTLIDEYFLNERSW